MCGIAAALFHTPELQDWAKRTVDSMLDRIGHRGFRSLTRSEIVGLSCMGCVRLPIRDPIAGSQPSFNADQSVASLFNGEIYNLNEFSGAMYPKGNSDRALLPFIYRESATAPPDEDKLLGCRGMFAIIIHDLAARPETVRLLRDHVGIKPLFLAETSEGILIASEAKAFLGEATLSVREIQPGSFETLTHQNGRWTQADIQDVRDRLRTGSGRAFDGSAASIRQVVSQAVASQWPGEDLPVAVLCSGGIDSSVIAYELTKHRSERQPLIAYTARCVDADSGSSPADSIAARRVCDALKIPCREIEITYDDLFNVLGDVIYHVETFEPNVVRNAAIQYHIMREIAGDGFRVAFCGEGADELFWGYADFAASPEPKILGLRLLNDLHRTQLQRVDRIGMAHTVEVRVPFLDETVVRLGLDLPAGGKHLSACGMWLGKALLREAYADALPDEIVLRRKATMAFGAGFGGVEMNDEPMNCRSEALLNSRGEDTASMSARHPTAFPAGAKTPERALYLQIYCALGFKLPSTYAAPTVAQLERA